MPATPRSGVVCPCLRYRVGVELRPASAEAYLRHAFDQMLEVAPSRWAPHHTYGADLTIVADHLGLSNTESSERELTEPDYEVVSASDLARHRV